MKFRAMIEQNGKTATGVRVPPEVVDGLGAGKRPAVRVTINGYTYRSTVGVMGGVFMLPGSDGSMRCSRACERAFMRNSAKGYRSIQFSCVVETNTAAVHLFAVTGLHHPYDCPRGFPPSYGWLRRVTPHVPDVCEPCGSCLSTDGVIMSEPSDLLYPVRQ